MTKFIKKYYTQIITVTILFVIITFMIVQSVRTMDMIEAESEKFKQMQLDYSLAEHFLNKIYELKHNTEYISNGGDWMNVLLSREDGEKVSLFSSLEELSEETGNESISISIKGVAGKGEVKAVPKKGTVSPVLDEYINMNIVIVGNYNDLIYFLKKVENMQYFSDVLSLNSVKANSITNSEEVERTDLLKTSMNVVFYLQGNK